MRAVCAEISVAGILVTGIFLPRTHSMPIRTNSIGTSLPEESFKDIACAVTGVEDEFVSITLTPTDRRHITVHRERWNATKNESLQLEEVFMELLRDWGPFLSLPLYYEATTSLLRGEERVLQETPIVRQGVIVSKQRVHLLTQGTAFKITASGESLESVEGHLRRFLSHTELRTTQCIKLYHHAVTFTTISAEK
jgi:hypothetical protein